MPITVARRRSAAAGALPLAAMPARAQAAWPAARPIRLVAASRPAARRLHRVQR